MPPTRNIHSLFWEIGINMGNAETIPETAIPPAKVATNAGNAQQMSVLDDVKRDKMAKALFFMGIFCHFKLLGQLAIRI